MKAKIMENKEVSGADCFCFHPTNLGAYLGFLEYQRKSALLIHWEVVKISQKLQAIKYFREVSWRFFSPDLQEYLHF